MIQPHLDLGIRHLLKDWRHLFTKRYLKDDILAGIAVACVAIPLSLAIALASGVQPELGIVAAIVGGIVCALFGGVPLAVSGPAAAMAVLVAAVVEEFGLPGLLVIGLGCGILQLLTGVLGLGTLIRFVPVPVIMGFTAGIGAIIIIGQFPRILGLPAPPESNILSVVIHIKNLIAHADLRAFLLAVTTFVIAKGLPKIWPRLPSPLFAVAIPSIAAYFLQLHVEIVGTIPSHLPAPQFPLFDGDAAEWIDLITATFLVYALASLETLLSAGSVDQLTKSKPHDSNQELIGQGLGNISSALFGGIPVTAVIARSALNVQSGGKTRRSAIFHSLFLIGTVYYFSPWMSQIPIAVLAGLLMTIALRMCSPHEFLQLWGSSRGDAMIYLVTFFMIVILGLLAGIQVGIIVALLLATIRLSQIKVQLHASQYGPAQLSLEGPLTFLSVAKIDTYQKKLAEMDLKNGLIIDLSRLRALDTSGATHLITLIDQLRADKVKCVLYVIDPLYVRILKGIQSGITEIIADDQKKMETILGIEDHRQKSTLDRLIYGIEQFKNNLHPRHKAIFSSLATTQQPHTLFITCCDSRIDPNLITSTQPGELFIVRNVGNIVPPFGTDNTPAEGAAIEYALGMLNVKQIIICAHSECGAMGAVISGKIFNTENEKKYPSVATWLSILKDLRNHFPKDVTPEKAAKLNASLQLLNLKTYPIVQERVANHTLKLRTFYYDIGNADIQVWDEVLGKYVMIGDRHVRKVF